MAEVKAAQGNHEDSETFLQQGLNLAHTSKQAYPLVIALTKAGELRLKRQQVESAAKAFHEATEPAKDMDIQEYIAKILYGNAQIAEIEADIRKVRDLGQESLGIFQSIKHQKAKEVRQWLDSLPSSTRS